jgi:hypothetical protein
MRSAEIRGSVTVTAKPASAPKILSLNRDHHRQPYWREALDRIAFDQKPRYCFDATHRDND